MWVLSDERSLVLACGNNHFRILDSLDSDLTISTLVGGRKTVFIRLGAVDERRNHEALDFIRRAHRK